MSRKKPTNLKIVEGTYRKDRDHPEPDFPEADIAAPENLSGVALETWNDIAPKLSEAGIFRATDRRTLEGYCVAWQNFRLAQKQVEQLGVMLPDSGGRFKKNPALLTVRQFLSELRYFSGLLGLDPVNRARLRTGGESSITDELIHEVKRRQKAKELLDGKM